MNPSAQRWLFRALMFVPWMIPGGLCGIEVSNQQIGNVTPFSFDTVWQVSETCSPEIILYSDNEGMNDITASVVIEYSPLSVGDPTISSDYAGRVSRRDLQSQSLGKNLFHARIRDLNPSTEYYIRIKAVDEIGTDLTTDGPLPLIPVTTATENAFISESRLLRMDFATTVPVRGAIAIVDSPGLPYPLIEVVGSGNTLESAFFNLDNLLDATGQTNLNPSQPLDLLIRLIGEGVPGGVMDYEVSYGGGFTSVLLVDTAFSVEIGSFGFDPVGNQQEGEPFTISISALDAYGNLITHYDGSVEITSNLALRNGGGTASGFAGGVLDRSLTFGESGFATVTASDGNASGTSNNFEVFGLAYQLTLFADPVIGGTLTGEGLYTDGDVVPIEAIPNPNFLFDRWSGDGVTDAGNPDTTVSMTAERSITALFVDDPSVIDYEEWKVLFFGPQAGDPVITAPGFDFDTDLQSNLWEYLTGQDPTIADPASDYPQIRIDESGLPVVSYVSDAKVIDLSVVIQTSVSPATGWASYIPQPSDVTETDLGQGLVLTEITIRPATPDRLFVRFTATLQSP